jgi:6-phosphogluconolactonase
VHDQCRQVRLRRQLEQQHDLRFHDQRDDRGADADRRFALRRRYGSLQPGRGSERQVPVRSQRHFRQRSAYAINATCGALTAISGSPFAAGTNPQGLGIDPAGRFLYTANTVANTVSQFTINPTTGVRPSIGAPVAAATAPTALVVDPTGRWVYVVSSPPGNVAGSIQKYNITAATGALVQSLAAVPTGVSPYSVVIAPGNHLYVANAGGGSFGASVSEYLVNGALSTSFSGSPAVPVFNFLSVDTTGRFLYVPIFGGVSACAISASSAALAFSAGSRFLRRSTRSR